MRQVLCICKVGGGLMPASDDRRSGDGFETNMSDPRVIREIIEDLGYGTDEQRIAAVKRYERGAALSCGEVQGGNTAPWFCMKPAAAIAMSAARKGAKPAGAMLRRPHHNDTLMAWDVRSRRGQTEFICVVCKSSIGHVQLGGRGYGQHCSCGVSYYLYTYRGIEFIKVLEEGDWGRMGFDCPHCKSEMCLTTSSITDDPKCMECGRTCTFAEASAYMDSTKTHCEITLLSGGNADEITDLFGRASYNNLMEAGRGAFDARFESVDIDYSQVHGGRTPAKIKFEYTRGWNPGLAKRFAGRGGAAEKRRLFLERLVREVGP